MSGARSLSAELIGLAFGDRMRTIRRARGLSQGDVSLYTGIVRPVVARLEAGRHCPEWDTCRRIGEALVVDPRLLAGAVEGELVELDLPPATPIERWPSPPIECAPQRRRPRARARRP